MLEMDEVRHEVVEGGLIAGGGPDGSSRPSGQAWCRTPHVGIAALVRHAARAGVVGVVVVVARAGIPLSIPFGAARARRKPGNARPDQEEGQRVGADLAPKIAGELRAAAFAQIGEAFLEDRAGLHAARELVDRGLEARARALDLALGLLRGLGAGIGIGHGSGPSV